MKTSDLFNYQTEAMRLLNNSYEKDKLVHAYLLDSEKGSGTIDAAIYMAKKLICKSETKPCMNCSDCKRIDSNSHLNFLYIEPTNDSIKKEQIEHLIHEFSMSSMEGNIKVYVIKDADKMNTSAENSLLKFLEEPNPNHYAFLTTTNFRRLLPTIVSRCQLIHFKPVPKNYLIDKLIDCGIEKDISYIISYLTSDLDRALKYIEEGKVINFLTVAKKIINKDLKGKDPYVEYYRNKILFLEEKDKEYHRLFLDMLILIYQELLKKLMNEEITYFKDELDVEEITMTKEEIIRKLDLLNLYQERFNYFVNLDLQYTSLFSKL
jgi:DNA polymerase-3 subunit delta'